MGALPLFKTPFPPATPAPEAASWPAEAEARYPAGSDQEWSKTAGWEAWAEEEPLPLERKRPRPPALLPRYEFECPDLRRMPENELGLLWFTRKVIDLVMFYTLHKNEWVHLASFKNAWLRRFGVEYERDDDTMHAPPTLKKAILKLGTDFVIVQGGKHDKTIHMSNGYMKKFGRTHTDRFLCIPSLLGLPPAHADSPQWQEGQWQGEEGSYTDQTASGPSRRRKRGPRKIQPRGISEEDWLDENMVPADSV